MFHWFQGAVTSMAGLLGLDPKSDDQKQSSYVERYSCPTQSLSQQQLADVARIQAAVRAQIIGQEPLWDVQGTLTGCTWPAQVLSLRDVAGYNLLQVLVYMSFIFLLLPTMFLQTDH